MRYTKIFIVTASVFSVLFSASVALAAAIPFSSFNIFVKSISTGQIISTSTDANGSFKVTVPDENGSYNIFINDESMSPIKMVAKNGIVGGRMVILTDGTTTKDPVLPAPVKKPAKLVKKVTPAIKTIKPVSH